MEPNNQPIDQQVLSQEQVLSQPVLIPQGTVHSKIIGSLVVMFFIAVIGILSYLFTHRDELCSYYGVCSMQGVLNKQQSKNVLVAVTPDIQITAPQQKNIATTSLDVSDAIKKIYASYGDGNSGLKIISADINRVWFAKPHETEGCNFLSYINLKTGEETDSPLRACPVIDIATSYPFYVEECNYSPCYDFKTLYVTNLLTLERKAVHAVNDAETTIKKCHETDYDPVCVTSIDIHDGELDIPVYKAKPRKAFEVYENLELIRTDKANLLKLFGVEKVPYFGWNLESLPEKDSTPHQKISLLVGGRPFIISSDYAGSCSLSQTLIDNGGRISDVRCWWAGAGDDFSIFKENDTYTVKKRWTQESGGPQVNAQTEGKWEIVMTLE